MEHPASGGKARLVKLYFSALFTLVLYSDDVIPANEYPQKGRAFSQTKLKPVVPAYR
jgi:hypothetical protein